MIPVCGAAVLARGVDCCIVGFGFGFAVRCFSLVDLLVGNLEWLFGCWVLGLCFRDCAWGC